MEASALTHAPRAPALAGRSALLRLQGDERLIALIRRGNQGAFETLVQRYQSRLLAFCRHMLGSTEDAEDVLQEVFASAYRAINADERPINARPWLYRIARNRCLNHLRRPSPAGQDSMDIFERDGGTTTADTVHKREEFRQIVSDVQELPETQRTALLLREMDALSYEQIAHAMDNTVPSVKSLLVRARVSLAEAGEARLLSCEEVRFELAEAAEGLTKTTPQGRRHVKSCDRCRRFRGELRKTNRALAAIYPLGPLVILKKLAVVKLGMSALGGGAAGGSGAAAGGAGAGAAGAVGASGGAVGAAGAGLATGAGAAAAGSAAVASSAGAGGMVGAGVSALASKAAAGVVAAAIVTAGAVEVKHVSEGKRAPATAEIEAKAKADSAEETKVATATSDADVTKTAADAKEATALAPDAPVPAVSQDAAKAAADSAALIAGAQPNGGARAPDAAPGTTTAHGSSGAHAPSGKHPPATSHREPGAHPVPPPTAQRAALAPPAAAQPAEPSMPAARDDEPAEPEAAPSDASTGGAAFPSDR